MNFHKRTNHASASVGEVDFFCKINHGKHNWVKSDSQEIIEKLKDIKNSVNEKEGKAGK